MPSIDGKQITVRDLGRKVYVIRKSGSLFGDLCRINSDFVFVRDFEGREHACAPCDVHWGSKPETQYKVKKILTEALCLTPKI